MQQLTLSEIWIYPIKSLGGIRLSSAKVFEKGLQYDRRWMLIDDQGIFMTQRINPAMALFKQSLDGTQLIVHRQNAVSNPSVIIDTTAPASDSYRDGSRISSRVWDDNVEVMEFDPTISHWFSSHLGMNVKLVFFAEGSARPVDPRFEVNKEHVSLADAYPFMMIGQASLDDLNSRMKQPLPMNRFRPNFVFTGGLPYEEDTWKNFRIGSNRFVGVKNCARCVLTTVNQDTAEKGAEPLLTMSTYRKRENKIYFGQNAVAVDHGVVNVGDKIVVG